MLANGAYDCTLGSKQLPTRLQQFWYVALYVLQYTHRQITGFASLSPNKNTGIYGRWKNHPVNESNGKKTYINQNRPQPSRMARVEVSWSSGTSWSGGSRVSEWHWQNDVWRMDEWLPVCVPSNPLSWLNAAIIDAPARSLSGVHFWAGEFSVLKMLPWLLGKHFCRYDLSVDTAAWHTKHLHTKSIAVLRKTSLKRTPQWSDNSFRKGSCYTICRVLLWYIIPNRSLWCRPMSDTITCTLRPTHN